MHDSSQSATPRGSLRGLHRRRVRFAATLVVASLLIGTALAGSLLSSSTAFAENDPAEETPPPGSTQAVADVGITAPLNDSFINHNQVTIQGTKEPGSTVTVTVHSATVCVSAAADTPRGTWECTAILPNGPSIVVTAVETFAEPVAGETRRTSDVTVHVLGAPSIAGGPVQLTSGIISGSGYPGSQIRLSVSGTAQSCAVVNGDGSWSCEIARGSGTYEVTATQTNPGIGTPAGPGTSRASGAVTIKVDKDRPEKPTIIFPRAGERYLSQPIVVSGTGEDRGNVEVRIDGLIRCTTAVSGPTWTCRVSGFSPGWHTVQAMMTDEAGNHAVEPGDSFSIVFGPAPAAELAPVPAPAPPQLPEPPVDPEVPAPAPSADDRADARTLPWLDRPIFPGADGQGITVREALTNWGTPTDFGTTIPRFGSTFSNGSWAWGSLLALLFIVLIAFPLRLLAGSLRGRFARPRLSFTGRNRDPDGGMWQAAEDEPKPANPWLAGSVPLATTAAIIVFAAGVNGEVRYFRLFCAVGIALAIVNVVGAALATRFAAGRLGVGSRLKFMPLLLLAAAVAAGLSRLTGIEPPIVTGMLIGAGFTLGIPARPRALVNLTQIGVTLALAVVAWLSHDAVGTVVGFWPSILSESLAALCLVGIGSALVLMLPLGPLPGRVILEWSPIAWFSTTFAVATVAGALVAGNPQPIFVVLASAVIATSFAVACVAAWSWTNYADAAHGHPKSAPSGT